MSDEQPRYTIGIDLGGTHIKAVAVDSTGHVLERLSRETQESTCTVKDWAESVLALIAALEQTRAYGASAVGMAAPGIPSTDQRCIEFLPSKLAGLVGFDWTTALNRDPLVPVLNDAMAAMLAEAWIGAAREYPNAIMLTLGTGVGGAILRNGELMRGAHGRAGHLGHLSLDPFGSKDIVNTPGALEDWIGNHNILERTQGRFNSTRDLVEAVRHGDATASRAWHKSIRALAAAIVSFINILDPDAVLIGGGIATAREDLFRPLQAELDELEWRLGTHRVPILPSALGEWAGALGAARHALNAS